MQIKIFECKNKQWFESELVNIDESEEYNISHNDVVAELEKRDGTEFCFRLGDSYYNVTLGHKYNGVGSISKNQLAGLNYLNMNL